jgi:hypothetical protein
VIGLHDALYTSLHDRAERVRWRMEDIPWHRVDRARISPELRDLVRDIAFAELTTTTATRRFLADFDDDPDFTRWVSVWFYEETRHPEVLLRWLGLAGASVDHDFHLRGRATASFMRSRMGTLVTNVISEMVASGNYAALHRAAPEPVLTLIARNLAADEARHAASFYSYAARYLEQAPDRDAARRDALKILYLWFQQPDSVQHPVNEFLARGTRSGERAEMLGAMGIDLVRHRERVMAAIGALVGLRLDGSSDLIRELRHVGIDSDREEGHS